MSHRRVSIISKKFFIIILGIAAYMLIAATNDAASHLLILTAYTGIIVFLSKLHFSHPYFWFTAFFYLYNCAYTIILMIAPDDVIARGYNPFATKLILVALIAFVLPISPTEIQYSENRGVDNATHRQDLNNLYSILKVSLIILVFSIIILQLQGVTSKQEQWQEHNLFWIFATYCTRIMTFVFAIVFFLDNNLKRNRAVLVICFLLVAYFTLITGERDAILRLIIIMIFVFAMKGGLKARTMLIVAPVGAFVMILSNYFKYFFSTGALNRGPLSWSTLLYEFLYSDFLDCGSNLQYLINEKNLEGCKGYMAIIYDSLSSIVPGSVMNLLFGGVENWNTSEWFNEYFFSGSTYSRAFTLVGEGYIIDGIIGTFVLLFLIGLGINYLYKKSSVNPYMAALYAYSAVATISSFRGDLGAILTTIIRVPIIVYLMLFLLRSLRLGKQKLR